MTFALYDLGFRRKSPGNNHGQAGLGHGPIAAPTVGTTATLKSAQHTGSAVWTYSNFLKYICIFTYYKPMICVQWDLEIMTTNLPLISEKFLSMVGMHCLDSDQTKYGVENHSPKKIILQKKSFEICIVFKVFIISSTFFTKFGFGQTVSIDLIYFFYIIHF